MSKENKGRKFYVDLIDLQRCDRTLGLGEGSGCRIVYYPHRSDLYRLVKVIQYSEFEQCQAKNEQLKQQLAVAVKTLNEIKGYVAIEKEVNGFKQRFELPTKSLATQALKQIEEIEK